jgi:tRNA dimethylallyltransferase
MNTDGGRYLVIVAGPTGIGKTALSIALAQHFQTEIISADSRQCYRGMSIGTAQPNSHERATVRHHFVDCFDPDTPVNAADFEQFALAQLEKLFCEHAVVIACGGTGLYIKALCEGLDDMPDVPEAITQSVEELYRSYGIAALQEALRSEDPAFETHEWQNAARLTRALSFVRAHGKSISSFRSGKAKARNFRVIKIALDMDRPVLYERINRRVDQMIAAGLEEEVRKLLSLRHTKNLQTVGYAELFEYFDGDCTREHAIEKIKQHSRNYAKRQLTWFRKDPEFSWVDAADPELVNQSLKLLQIKMAE